MLLTSVYFVFLASLAMTVNLVGMSASAADVFSRPKDNTIPHHSPRPVPELWSSSAVGRVAKSRQFRRAFKRSLVQIFGMKTRPRRKATTGVGQVPAYMRWLYEESSAGRLPSVLRHLRRRRSASPHRQKRHSQVTANTVRSFVGTYVSNLSTDSSFVP